MEQKQNMVSSLNATKEFFNLSFIQLNNIIKLGQTNELNNIKLKQSISMFINEHGKASILNRLD